MIMNLYDNLEIPLSVFGEVLTAKNIPHTSWRFDYSINPKLYVTATTNGTITTDQSRAKLSTSANANSFARLQTKRRLRYLPGVGGHVLFTAVFDVPAEGCTQIIGVGDTQDGLFVGYNGLSFGIMRRRDSVDNWTAQTAWNGDKVTFTPQLGNVFIIDYQWLGFGFIPFYIEDPSAYAIRNGKRVKLFRLIHVIEYPNTSQLTSILNPTLPVMAEIRNTTNATDKVMYAPSGTAFAQGGVEADYHPLDVFNSVDALATYNNTDNNHLVSLRNDTTLGAINNRVPIDVRSIVISRGSSGTTLTRFRLYVNGTTAIPLVFADVDAVNSPAQTSATVTTVTSANADRAYALSTADTTLIIPFERGELTLQPNDVLTIGVQNSGVQSTEVIVTVNWAEQF